MSEDSLVLGNRLQTLQLGRYKGKLVNMFENPRLGADTHGIAEIIRIMQTDSALEFQRKYDVGVISSVVAVPPLASLIFGIVWVGSDLRVPEGCRITARSLDCVCRRYLYSHSR